jgi:DNA-directed RNA polymerase subunit E'/Rpb7
MITNPYIKIIQHTRIAIEAYHMTSDIKNNMKSVLKKKLEKKCNKNGYIDEIYRITEYSDGMMPPENLNGGAIYDISYYCKICIPIENTIIIGLVRVINQELIIAIHGPIVFFIPKENIDINIWDLNNNNCINKKTNNKLLVGDYINIQIVNKRINQNDTQIKTLGLLLDLSIKEDIDNFYGNKIITEKNNESNYII